MTESGNESSSGQGPVTQILSELRRGAPGAREELFRHVHGELKRLAGAYMRRERSDHTLQPTALVNEAYVRLMGSGATPWTDRAQFFRCAAAAMREILVDSARAKSAQKRGGGRARVTLRTSVGSSGGSPEEILAIHDALAKLQSIDAVRGHIVELRFFGGLTLEEIAEVLDISRRSVCRKWEAARLWLFREIAA